jgi:chorismate mutase
MRASKTNIRITTQSSFRKTDGTPVLFAGPCSAETETQVLQTAMQLKNMPQVNVFKSGIWKSRTRPDSFEGVGTVGLTWLQKVKAETGLKVACDVANAQQTEEALAHGIDILCLSGRATVNPYAVQEIANVLQGTGKPILVNNPVYTDLGLWIGALERLYKAGLDDLGAIHRGFSGDGNELYRNHPKWEIVLQLRNELPELPVLCDASHIAGKRSLLYPVGQRALDLGLEGLILESHLSPATALSSRQQQLQPKELELLLNALQTGVALNESTKLAEHLDTLSQEVASLDKALAELLIQRTAVASQLNSYGLGDQLPEYGATLTTLLQSIDTQEPPAAVA